MNTTLCGIMSLQGVASGIKLSMSKQSPATQDFDSDPETFWHIISLGIYLRTKIPWPADQALLEYDKSRWKKGPVAACFPGVSNNQS